MAVVRREDQMICTSVELIEVVNLMKYDYKKFISLYLMTWNDSFRLIAG